MIHMLKATSLNDLLAKLLAQVKDLIATLVVDLDGLVIAQQSIEGFDEEIIGAIMSVLEQTISRIKRFAETSFGSGTFDTNEFRLFYLELGGSIPAIFVMVADPYANLDQFIPYSYIVAEKITKLLNDEEISIKLPTYLEGGKLDLSPDDDLPGKNKVNQIFLIGPDKCGKTSLLEMYTQGELNENYRPTIGLGIYEKVLQITKRNRTILTLFDMGGLKSFAKVRKYFYKISDARAVIILFDYTREETLDQATEWIEEARFFTKKDSIFYILVGNKLDLLEDRTEIKEKAERIAKENECLFFETSALTGQGIDELFMHVAFNCEEI
ncbi:MAG: GTP-binding protein [Candidatus Lokiarchaeota archaeon]|nr:GTP-binding protein [Candidatus Lokiarchaeota archaeon]MBD3341826.1 GTP-binding protein [Candidatus Lokiarchaeota archaeon]